MAGGHDICDSTVNDSVRYRGASLCPSGVFLDASFAYISPNGEAPARAIVGILLRCTSVMSEKCIV